MTPIRANEHFVASTDGVFMSAALYQEVRRAVADRILELQPKP